MARLESIPNGLRGGHSPFGEEDRAGAGLAYDLIYGERVLRSVTNFTRQDAEAFLQ